MFLLVQTSAQVPRFLPASTLCTPSHCLLIKWSVLCLLVSPILLVLFDLHAIVPWELLANGHSSSVLASRVDGFQCLPFDAGSLWHCRSFPQRTLLLTLFIVRLS